MPVYFISDSVDIGRKVKIGRSGNIDQRLKNLQTGNPNELFVLGYIYSGDDRALEKEFHRRFADRRGRGEWFNIGADELLPDLKAAGSMGFLSRSHIAYEFIGNDWDGLPEFAFGAEWADLEPQECCPNCGCFCGMWYSDAFGWELCQQCGYTGWELEPNGEDS